MHRITTATGLALAALAAGCATAPKGPDLNACAAFPCTLTLGVGSPDYASFALAASAGVAGAAGGVHSVAGIGESASVQLPSRSQPSVRQRSPL